MTSLFPAALDAFPLDKVDGTPQAGVHAAQHNDLADAANKTQALLGVQPAAPGNLGAAYTLNLANAKLASLVGTLNANHTLTLTNLRVGALVVLVLRQDATTGNWTFQITVNGASKQWAVNASPGAATAFLVVPISSTDYVLVPLGA